MHRNARFVSRLWQINSLTSISTFRSLSMIIISGSSEAGNRCMTQNQSITILS